MAVLYTTCHIWRRRRTERRGTGLLYALPPSRHDQRLESIHATLRPPNPFWTAAVKRKQQQSVAATVAGFHSIRHTKGAAAAVWRVVHTPVRRRPPVEVGALSCLLQLQQLQVQEKKRSIILIPPSSQMYWILLLLRGRIVARPNKAGRYVLLYVRSPTRRGEHHRVQPRARQSARACVVKRELL